MLILLLLTMMVMVIYCIRDQLEILHCIVRYYFLKYPVVSISLSDTRRFVVSKGNDLLIMPIHTESAQFTLSRCQQRDVKVWNQTYDATNWHTLAACGRQWIGPVYRTSIMMISNCWSLRALSVGIVRYSLNLSINLRANCIYSRIHNIYRQFCTGTCRIDTVSYTVCRKLLHRA